MYGFAKINGAQFTVLDSELTRPLGEVSGFWLTWHYFGYSPVYRTLIALLEIDGGILLIIPRTALLAALALLPMAVNILLIDILYGVDPSGTAAALVLCGCLISVVAPHTTRLLDAVLLRREPARPSTISGVVLAVILAGAFTFTWWGANYNNRAPTEIDGVWSVTSQEASLPAMPRWRQVFFERNRAFMAVFRSADAPDARHHFEIDADRRITVWRHWLRKGDVVMRGRMLDDGRIELRLEPDGRGGTLILERENRLRPAGVDQH